MTLKRFMCFLTLLILPMHSAGLAQAHDGHTHVMGTVTGLTDGHMAVQMKGGQTETIQLDRNTRYRAAGVATSSATIRVGDRVVVEVTEEANGLRAAEVRYAPVAPAAP